jgi:GNAT superfamily N-acetyltransferase
LSPRVATVEDVPALVDAYGWLFAAPAAGPPVSWDRTAAAERLRALIGGEERFTAFVADGPDALAGFVTVYLDILSVRYGPRAWVEDLAVDPAARSQGIGKALLDAAKDWARAHGAAHLELDSSFARADAHRFYEREQPSWDARSFGWVL